MNPDFLRRLDDLRQLSAVGLIVTDDYRTEEDVKRIYGDDESQWPHWLKNVGSPHERGLAVDLQPLGGMRQWMQVIRTALNMNAEGDFPRLGLGVYDRHIHVDADRVMTRPRLWTGESK